MASNLAQWNVNVENIVNDWGLDISYTEFVFYINLTLYVLHQFLKYYSCSINNKNITDLDVAVV